MIALETSRLLLREFMPEDAPAMFELNSDPEVMCYTGDKPFATVEEAEALIRNYSQYTLYRSGRLTVILKETGEILGWCGLKYHTETGLTDLGYRLKHTAWNKGYATEASRACLSYGFDTLQLPWVYACADARNTASVQVMKKLGMAFWKDTLEEGVKNVYYRLEKKL